ncbi:MAG TPA: fibronectin type III domain-containing protein, partial [candidate division Zixibacteria bacterium]|nr:fibronectin type III domain-containing protein [candidate division Zixibacteria bacterium]
MKSTLKKTYGRILLALALGCPAGSLAAAPDSASLPEFFQPPEFLRGALSSQAVDGPLAAHTSGSFGATVSGAGHVGRWFTVGTDPLLPSFQYPRGSRVEYLRAGALWVGGIVDGDTSTTVSKDGWLWWSVGELWPEEPDSALRLVSGPADQNYEAVYTDTAVFDLTWDPIDGYHRPLNLRVTQRSYSWRTVPFDDFLIIEYHIENIGAEIIHDAWAGLYFDGDVGYVGSEIGTLPNVQTDDLAGFLADDGIAYILDNDGHNSVLSESWDTTSPRAAIGVKILDLQPAPQYATPNFNWWLTGGDSLSNWGPRLAGTPTDPYRDFGRFTGVPVGDANKYYVLSHREQDYDQVFSALDHSDDGWLPPVFSAGPNHALGGDTLLLVVAIAIGAETHIGPNDFYDYFDPYWPDFIYDTWDFRDLRRNMHAAESLYFSGYNTPVYSPPPAPRVTETVSGARVSWVYSGNQYVNGYDVYFRKIPNNLVFCDAFPVDTPSLSAAQIINTAPVTSDEYFLDNLEDGVWYQVAVAVTPEGGRQAEISEVTLFKTGRPEAPLLRKPFASEEQRGG